MHKMLLHAKPRTHIVTTGQSKVFNILRKRHRLLQISLFQIKFNLYIPLTGRTITVGIPGQLLIFMESLLRLLLINVLIKFIHCKIPGFQIKPITQKPLPGILEKFHTILHGYLVKGFAMGQYPFINPQHMLHAFHIHKTFKNRSRRIRILIRQSQKLRKYHHQVHSIPIETGLIADFRPEKHLIRYIPLPVRLCCRRTDCSHLGLPMLHFVIGIFHLHRFIHQKAPSPSKS